MKGNISQNGFYQSWVKICNQNKIEFKNKWGGDFAEYTDMILKNDNSITSQLAKLLGLHVSHEYYSMDAIFYSDEDLVINNPKNKTWTKTDGGIWLTSFQIAFEHENRPFGIDGAYQEICHLLTLKANLKVLVTYCDKEYLDGFVADLNSAIPRNVLDNTPILIIIGCEDAGEYIWRGYSIQGYLGVTEIH